MKLLKGGAYISLNPCRRGSLYIFMKRHWEQTGKWPYGPEYPVGSLRSAVGESFRRFSLSERNLDFRQTAAMLSAHEKPAIAWLGRKLCGLSRRPPLDWLLLHTLGGYILLSRVEKLQ